MTRRTLLTSALGGPLLLGQEQAPRLYSRIVPDYYRALAQQAYERRNAALAKVTTPSAVRERQAWVRETFWRLAGGKPEPCAPNVRTTGSFERPGYRVEKLVYESQPGLHVPANLYLPEGAGPFPGVLFQMGHSQNGKAAEPYQKCCQGLARLGYVVLAFDPMGQGERIYVQPRPGHSLSADDQHTVPGKQLLLTGDSATRMQAWDAVVSLNILASHPKVDPKRLASTGQSGGGTLTMFLIAVDERLAAAAVSSGNTENFACAGYNPPGSVDDAEQDLVGSGPAGFDRWDTLYPMAPKPLLITASTRDFFGTYSPNYLASGREEFAKLKKMYRVLGAESKLRWFTSDLPHALSKDMRMQIYSFFEKELKGSDRVIADEPEVHPESDETLQVGRSGDVARDFGSTTPQAMAKVRSVAMQPSGKLDWIRMRSPEKPALRVIGKARGEHATIETIEVESEPGVWLPAYSWVPEKPKAVLLIAEPGGRTAHWREGDLCHRLAAEHIQVVAFDVRCIGDLRPEVGRGNPGYNSSHANELSYAWAGLILGRSLLEQRVTDMVAMARAMQHGLPVILAARGHLTVPASFAAAMEPRIQRIYTSGGIGSYRALLDVQDPGDLSFTNVVPGILAKSDVPELGARVRQGSWDFDALLHSVD